MIPKVVKGHCRTLCQQKVVYLLPRRGFGRKNIGKKTRAVFKANTHHTTPIAFAEHSHFPFVAVSHLARGLNQDFLGRLNVGIVCLRLCAGWHQDQRGDDEGEKCVVRESHTQLSFRLKG